MVTEDAKSAAAPAKWRKTFAEAKAEISGDVATEIALTPSGKPGERVRLYITPRGPSPVRAGGALRQFFRDLSDRSERGDPKALFNRYGTGCAPLAMSVPLTAAGVAILFLVPRQAPHQVMPYVFGSIFALAGVFLFTMGLSGVRAAAEPPTAAAKDPWRTDNAWNPTGARPDAPGRSVAGFLGGLLFLLLIGAFNVLWTVQKDVSGWVVFSIVIGIFDLIALLVIGSIFVALFQRIRAGVPRLSWNRFPFFTGERIEARFASGRRLQVTGPVRAILRCVEQLMEQDSQGRPEVHPYAVYAKTQAIEVPGGGLVSAGLSFDIPPGAPGTNLSKPQSTYWLLEIRAPLAGPDFSTRFLLPIYARREGSSD